MQSPSHRCRPLVALLLPLVLLAGAFFSPAARAEDEPAPSIERDPAVSAEHYEDALVAREEGRMGDAATSFWKSLESDLLNYRAHVGYIQCALAAGDARTEIIADYDKFLYDYPKLFDLKLHRLRLDPAEARLEQLTKLGKDKTAARNPNLHLEQGRALMALGDAKKALAALEKAQALKSGDRPDILHLLAEAEHAAEKTDEAIARLDATVKANAEDFESRLLLARLLLGTKDFENSAKHATTVVEQRPSYLAAFLIKAEALSGVGTAEAMNQARETLTNAYRANKENNDVVIALADLTARDDTEASYKQAIAYYDEVLARDEESHRAMYGKAWVLERMEQWEPATELYREVMAVRPSSHEAVNSVGYCLFKQGRVSEAQVQFKRALDMKKDFVTAKLNLGATFDAQAKYDEAIKIYEQVLKTKGQDKNLRAIINCAFDYEAKGSFPKALKLLKEAHEILPEDPNIVTWIGDNHYFQEKWKDAERWYQEAVQMDEKSFFAWRGLGLTYAQTKKWDDSIAALEKARALKKDDLDLLVLIGDIYYTHLKDLKTALERYQEFVQRGGNDPDVNDAIIEIKKELEKKR